MSTHSVPVIRILEVLPHPNADSLEIIPIPGTMWRCVSQKGLYKPGDLAIHIEPDYVVPTNREEFAWLKKEGDKDEHRVKPVRLRGTLSYGLLIEAPKHELLDKQPAGSCYRAVQPGDNFMRALGIKRYVIPEDKTANNQQAGADNLQGAWPVAPMWHLESLEKFPAVLVPNEPVVVTEKLDGTSARYLWQDGQFYVGTRTRWLSPDFKDNYWQVAVTPNIRRWCQDNEGTILYGEIIGAIKSIPLKYGFERGIQFRAFNAYAPGDRWNAIDGIAKAGIPSVPLVYVGPWKGDMILPLAEQDTKIVGAPSGHMAEGLVIQPEVARNDPDLGNVCLKFVSERYWTTKPAR